MGFGKLLPSMAERLEKHIRGQTVWDLGAGDMTLSRKLLQLGAAGVVAVDKERSLHPVPKGVRFLQDYFNAVQAPAQISVAFVSWPQNTHLPGLLELLQKSAVVVYLGKNTDGTSCGNRRMFEHFRSREVLEFVADPKNTLIVYGEATACERPPLQEETAGFYQEDWYEFVRTQAEAYESSNEAI